MKDASRQDQPEIKRILQGAKSGFVAVGVFSMFINLLMLVQPFYMLQVFDRVLRSRSTETLLFLSLVVLGLFILMGILQFIRSRILVRVGVSLDERLGERLFDAMFRNSLRQRGGGSPQAIDDLSNVRQFLTGPGILALFDAPWMPVYLGVMFLFNTWLGLYGVACTLIIGGLTWANEVFTRAPLAKANEANRNSRRFAGDNLRNAEVIHAMGMEPAVRERWLSRQARTINGQAFASDRAGVFSNASRVFRFMAQAFAYGIGALLVLQGQMSGGMIIACAILIGRALAPLDQITGAWRQIQQARESYGRLSQLFDGFPEQPRHTSLPAPQGSLRLANVLAAPPGTRTPVLRGVGLNVEPGEGLGVIGPSAAGKSSLVRVILGVWPLLNGSVRLDGADIDQYNRDEIGPYIGYLPQDIELFEGTVSQNIARFGEATDEAVVAAAKLAGAHEMILQLPDGYDTAVGVGGNTLSAGQRQRIGLARALFGTPRLVILDEPNSNLDDAGEQALTGAVERLKAQGVTVLVVTHRRSILAQMDKLLVLQQGQVAAFGAREEVLSRLQSNTAQPLRVAGNQQNKGAS
ncbi:type I secretion system permease/ATPase [Spiribacter aquaticus]|uniref:Type I secretion system permease/ATPase n=1 Tax=Spiribacter aquaticus TaxID=1935996 RepID=A0A557RLT1_9GAMM|nr:MULTISPECIES: type I secretion system permease/ATPase [Spiribacter]KAF0279177.1 peptidase [Spiribacter roseus]TVO66139.1 type I secretion system permease/ATPase [Spiribacter aquaticus]